MERIRYCGERSEMKSLTSQFGNVAKVSPPRRHLFETICAAAGEMTWRWALQTRYTLQVIQQV